MIKLLALLSLLLMPFLMAPATAAPHQAMAGMPMQHCPDRDTSQKGKLGFADCTMACAGALPAADRSPVCDFDPDPAPAVALPTNQLHGLHPEIATPPPKRS